MTNQEHTPTTAETLETISDSLARTIWSLDQQTTTLAHDLDKMDDDDQHARDLAFGAIREAKVRRERALDAAEALQIRDRVTRRLHSLHSQEARGWIAPTGYPDLETLIRHD